MSLTGSNPEWDADIDKFLAGVNNTGVPPILGVPGVAPPTLLLPGVGADDLLAIPIVAFDPALPSVGKGYAACTTSLAAVSKAS